MTTTKIDGNMQWHRIKNYVSITIYKIKIHAYDSVRVLFTSNETIEVQWPSDRQRHHNTNTNK